MTQLHEVHGARQPMQTAGMSPSVGRLGPHSVQIGANPPIRLDQIKGNKIPFAGFRTATKVASAKAGARDNAASALRALGGGKALDARGLLNSCKALQAHLDRLSQLGHINGDMDQAVLAALAPEVESLSNTELSSVYQCLLSPETELLKQALQAEIRANPGNADALAAAANLFNLEALVIKELSNRVIVAQGLAPSTDVPALSDQYGAAIADMGEVRRHETASDMSGVSLHVLADVATDSALRRGNMESVAQDLVQRRALEPIDARQLGDVLRSTDLTINVDLEFLFGMNGPKPLLKAGGAWEHIFHSIESAPDEEARQAAIEVKGQGYILKRDNVERAIFPELSEDRPTVASERPTYAALNLLHRQTGEAAPYGTVALHLKPEVARRATYTVNDSFCALQLRFSDAGYNALLDLLPDWSGISEEHKLELMRPASKLRHQLDHVLERMEELGSFRGDLFKNVLQVAGLDADENSALAGLFIKVFKDTDATRKTMATYDNLETLLPELGDVNAVSLARAAVDRQNGGTGRVALECQYIEAQLHAPLVLARDVQEIVIAMDFGAYTTINPDQKAWMNAVIAVLEGKKPAEADMARLSPEQHAELGAIREQLGGATIPVRLAMQEPELGLPGEVQHEENAFYADHFDQVFINDTLEAINDDVRLAEFIRETFRLSPNGTALFETIRDTVIISKDDYPAVRAAFAEAVEQFRHHPVEGQRTENELLIDCMRRAIRQQIGAERLDCLAAIPGLTASPTQRRQLRDWVMAQTVPLSKEAFHALASTALEGAALLNDMAAQAPGASSDEDVMRRLGAVAGSLRQKLDDLPPLPEGQAEGRIMGACGGLALALANASPEARRRMAEGLNTPGQRDLSSLLLRLGDSVDGFSQAPGFKDARAFNAIRSGLCAAFGNAMEKAPAPFAQELSLVPQDVRAGLRAALPGLADTLDASFPPHPAFPAAAQPGRMPSTPAQHRRFLLDILPIYHDHERPGNFDYGTAYHGRGHICRAFIFASTMAGIMEGMGHEVDRTALLCGIAGHDAGRERSGADTPEQEAASARLALDLMHRSFGEDTFGKAYEEEFTQSIIGHASPTLESMLLNAADSLDIVRVKDFDFNCFPFLRGGTQEGPKTVVPEYQGLREQLHEEAYLLARMTDPRTQVKDLCAKLAEAGKLETVVEVQHAASDAVIGQLALEKEEDFLAFIEGKIRAHPDMFPLLTRYYLNPLDA
ncbi:MAG TPA: DUF3626 domain-containing protein [Candidatus Bilophila faecipullorum]|uniref:DUF3626 domain-containing protein n=7 Tax=Bilophila TaxID=35832 RepID=A0A9D1R071_9BACT|nr:DUF3626 domain-containing protein [uncultured Bilophila sp.]HIW78617.1 DUF3626 domain-containing protein [Candidatus Bilophila faecipullorum]